MSQIDNKYISTLLLHAIGDTIGFKNGEWEFKLKTLGPIKGATSKLTEEYTKKIFENIPLEKMYEFIDLGGINYVPQKGWLVSDDTIMHMKTAESLLEKYNSLNSLGEIFAKNYVGALDILSEKNFEKRYPGITTMDNLYRLRDGGTWNTLPYDYRQGGSGASMRTLCIGLVYHGEQNRQKLIQVAIENSRITHNSVIGYLGGLTSALFTAYAIEGVDIKKWPFLLIKLFDDKTIYNYIKAAGRDLEDYEKDHHVFINKWNRYIEDKFDESGNPKKRRADTNLVHRTKYYHENFAFESERTYFPGSGGDDSVIIAYDCVLDSGESWEKLVVYSMLHGGDTDTTGSIAGGWWGAIHGLNGIPEHLLDHLEFREKLIKLGDELFKNTF